MKIQVKTLVLLGTLLFSIVHAEESENVLLRGKAFSNPSVVVEMPEKWRQQPLNYRDWAKGADLAVNFDQQMYPLILPAIQQFAKDNKINIATWEGTCGTAAKDLTDKAVDMGGFCCPPSQNDRLPGLKFHTLGIEAIPILVHPNNPVNNLTFEQIQQIFQGSIARWSDVEIKPGVPGAKNVIQVVGRLHCKQRPGHWRLLLDNEDLFSPRLINVGTIADMISQVATDPHAIGFEELWMLERYRDKGEVKVLSVNAVTPHDLEQLARGKYPVYNTMGMAIWDDSHLKNPLAQRLVDHLLAHVETIDAKYGIVSAKKLRAAGWKFFENELIGELGS